MPTAQPLRTGDPRRLGAYELSGRLGEGGQGVVYLGTRGEDTYAVKLLHGPVGDERAAFLREVELAKHVARFCTAQVVEAGFDEGRPYIVSEYVDGPSLQRHVALTGPRSGAALERLAVSTATALAAIHRAGIVHRDFKPQNVLLGFDGPRVIDFGLARALDAAATVSGRGVGTPAYMAPEQITASAVTRAADVFSWGATMCFAANASAPFGQDSVAPVLHRILTAPPEMGRLDGRLRELVETCLDKDPRNRPSSRELLLQLLGDAEAVPAEVLRSPPPHILRVPSRDPATPLEATGPFQPESWPEPAVWHGPVLVGAPVAEPEATGASRGYRLPASRARRTGRAVNRAGLAVSAALLVSTAVLVTVVVPGLRQDGPPQAATGPTVVTAGPGDSVPGEGGLATQEGRESPETVEPSAGPPARTEVGVRVPVLDGLDRPAATAALKRAGLVAGTVTQVDSSKRIGQVLGSQPGSGASVPKGSAVALRVSAGLVVPAVTGLQRAAAQSALTSAGLAAGSVTTSCSSRPDGQVLSSRPAAGTRTSGGAKVAFVVSREGAAVPAVVGRSGPAARTVLRAAGFTVTQQARAVTDEAQAGAVLAQSVAAGTCGKPGTSVAITVGVLAQTDPDPTEPSEPPATESPQPTATSDDRT
ncbi:protein kinase domain-containing protein [Nonomuraea lactucae]|uniref:protein kinase domain-containing protein n=1 Tax=Nonomuraea lactucae TaxID=2249762 RepID=UPI0013B37FEB|nr:PASTA domain-containing protein [Nonomuraea lactucae]